MTRARINIDRDPTVAEVPHRLFGSLVEQAGRRALAGVAAAGNQLTLTLPALSWSVVELEVEKA